MAYTINIHEKVLVDAGVRVIILISDGTREKWLDVIVNNIEDLRSRIREAIIKDTHATNFYNNLKLGPIIIPPPSNESSPTAEEKKLADFNNIVEKLQIKKRHLDLGIATQEEYNTLLELAKQLK